MDTIEIPALNRPVDATVEIPGSKSITNRALLVAALAQGDSILENALFSEDSTYFAKCLENLEIAIVLNSDLAQIQVTGRGGEIPAKQADLFVGLSGTTARFISALVALGKGKYRLDGVPRMRERPMGDLLKVLQTGGATINFEGNPGFMPYTIDAQQFSGGHFCLKANQTSQQLSALLMITPYAQQDTTVEVEGTLVSQSYVKMTCRLMADFGVEVLQTEENQFQIKAGQRYQGNNYTIEPDASNASYFFAAAAVTGGRVRVNHLTKQSCQGDILWLNVLEQMGCQINCSNNYTEVIGPKQLQGIDIDMNDMSDLVQTLGAIAPFASSSVTIRNVEHIRYKETERIRAVVTELRRLGVKVEEFADGLKIEPSQITPAEIETYHDHRMAMAFAVTGLKVPGIIIKDPGCTAKTFPDYFTRFFQMLDLS
ncbi:3-phosphoshikimate 1-carboxyvinyltransferase [Aetokthonos hydrillicola Thurmond2011]|uniref:3-phosphoshikimate 1-carboxyvinyltransferase n=1 Tax=Aetokthonos hydrillicola Thurmond2011 TaxID=2712845 RepID=A0AAP5MD39_9CYAN|nr:3-phosphoshikimate 1-carboxyvinyltransferase [Aetokthonos hydrillicola]MBO3457929.1 3-phosphoshikimate 1-carboxyvinyltransferase [Aetokthonos hydrillicola CCALA 1050]MBW4587419.1 3-phosphoshikimate 1-carboxyvinyltransferase [Aetokthonos hydrillicola CCALA 1050]MDR9899987.1 3-phosphoshikimate 1-carboxyvinyltransferase [Aetokthonos hydrillicola Thurmond2011]